MGIMVTTAQRRYVEGMVMDLKTYREALATFPDYISKPVRSESILLAEAIDSLSRARLNLQAFLLAYAELPA
jgi:hypothetical protein